MAKIKYIGVLPKNHKIYGTDFGDRIIFGKSVFSNTLQPLPSDDKRRILQLCDFAHKKEMELYGNRTGLTSTDAHAGFLRSIDHSINDRHTPPIFQSSILTMLRDEANYACQSGLTGNFKGAPIVFTVDTSGSVSDLLPPGMKLHVTTSGLVHTVEENGEIKPFIYPSTTLTSILNGFDRDGSTQLKNGPMIVGYSLLATAIAGASYNPNYANYTATSTHDMYFASKAANVQKCKIIGQDSTYIYFFQQFNDASGSTYSYSASAAIDHCIFMAVKKSNGDQYIFTTVAANVCHTLGMSGSNFLEMMTVEATPKKAILHSAIGRGSKASQYLCVNKIIDKTITSIATLDLNTTGISNALRYEIEPTQWMDCLTVANANYKKCYYPYISGMDNATTYFSGLCMLKQHKDLTTAPTLTKCTLSNIPTEYANAALNQVMKINNPAGICKYDIAYAAEIYEGSEQFVAFWIGITKNPTFLGSQYTSTNCFKEVDSSKYRFFLIFRVNPDSDTNLIYQGCISSFKDAKPMYGFVASPDNKQIVAVNEDGVYCYNWSSSAKTFVHVDTIALSRVMSMGMPGKNSSNKQSVWIETLKEDGVFDLCDSDVYQITFGDYINADLRYFDASKGVYVENFALSSLPVSKTGLVYDAKTFTAQCRVKSKIDGVESEFTTGKLVRIRISGVREADGVSIVDCDAGIPWQKTITTTSAWTDITFNYSNPISGLQISAEIIE